MIVSGFHRSGHIIIIIIVLTCSVIGTMHHIQTELKIDYTLTSNKYLVSSQHLVWLLPQGKQSLTMTLIIWRSQQQTIHSH